MFTHGQERVARDALLRAIRRALNFSDLAESDLISWLGAFPPACPGGDFPPGFLSELLSERISRHSHVGLLLAIPPQQQINAETATQFLGLAGLILTAATIISLTGRAIADFIPSPDYFQPERLIALLEEESLPVAILFHRFAAGRVGGRTLLGGHFLWKCASILGAHIEEPDSFPGGDETLLQGRSYLLHAAVLADLRRFRRPLGSLTRFLATARVVFRGFGFYLECSVLEAILIATDVFLVSSGLSRHLGALSTLTQTSGLTIGQFYLGISTA